MDQPSYPQLQLGLPSKKEPIHMKADIYINKSYESAIIGSKVYYNYFNSYNSPKTSYGEPFIMTLIEGQDLPDRCLMLLPAKHLWNLSDGSTANFIFSKFEDLTSENPSTIYFFELRCIKNPDLRESFQEQFSKYMNNFYKIPSFDSKNPKELADHNIITNPNATTVILPNGYTATVLNCKHGTKGISSEKKLVEIMQKEKTAPYKNSAYRFVMQRQLGFKK
jgi:hypothetical protein